MHAAPHAERNVLEVCQLETPAVFKSATLAAARVITGTQKFDRGLPCLLHSELHWLDVP